MNCPRCLRGRMFADLDGESCVNCGFSPVATDADAYAERNIPHNVQHPRLRGERAIESRRESEQRYRARKRMHE